MKNIKHKILFDVVTLGEETTYSALSSDAFFND
jgi:hypothetical protein